MLTPPGAEPGSELSQVLALRKAYGPAARASKVGTSRPNAPQLRTRISSRSLVDSTYRASSVLVAPMSW
ncbi:hypothetical protein OG271_01915 [Micromonospora rifamycinica]|uniref:hypothetical protein n=1 Tax=Micromonospora rifamycinica TaxID=291594 RepID=UPI002E29AF4E|nr:hypothetical protein [Micromonospora rifamycinica]